MSETKTTVIKSLKWFGVTVFQKSRISESKLNLEFESVHCDDIGLYVIGKYPRLTYGGPLLRDDFNWQRQANDTIRLTILNLINKRVIEVIKVNDEINFLYKSFPRQTTDYYFNVSDLQLDKDWFSQLVYKSINEVNQTKYPTLFNYISSILDKVIYARSTYGYPSQAFIIQVLRKYVKTYPWIQLDTKSRFLGLVDKHSLKVEEIYIPRIDMQHKALSELDNRLFRSNNDYSNFSKRLSYEIQKDFKRRKTNTD